MLRTKFATELGLGDYPKVVVVIVVDGKRTPDLCRILVDSHAMTQWEESFSTLKNWRIRFTAPIPA